MEDQKKAAQGFVFLQGMLNTGTVTQQINHAKFDPKKTVYIFPGNSSHHTSSSTLFSKKGGSGLATVAANVGLAEIPTLSLPTRDVDSSTGIPKISQIAVADLWKAVGYGFSLALPVRPHPHNPFDPTDPEYDPNYKLFQNSLNGINVEPSFWGKEVKRSDPGLAKYYLDELDRLRSFLDGTPDQKQQILEELKTKFPEAHLAYQAGQKAKTSDTPPDWFKPNEQPVAKKVNDVNKSVTSPTTAVPKESSEVVETESSKKSDSVKKTENSSTNPLLEYHLKETKRLINLHHPTTILEILEIQKQAAANTEAFFAKVAQASTAEPVVSQQEFDWGPVPLNERPTASFFTDKNNRALFDKDHKVKIDARSDKNALNTAQNRHITPISMLKRHVKNLLLEGRTIEEASKIILSMSEVILEDLRTFSNTGEKTIVTKEEIITKFFDYFKSNPERLTGDKNKDDFIIVFQRLFSTYAMAPFGVLPAEGNTPEPEKERQMVRIALDLFENYEQKTIEKFALQGKIAKGELQAEDEEVKKSLAENTLTGDQLEQIASELFKIFDYKALPADTKQAREEAIYRTTSIKKATEAQNYFPEPLQKGFEDYAADQEKALKGKLLTDNPKFIPRGKNKKKTDFKTYLQEIKGKKKITDPILFQSKGLKSFPEKLSKTIKTTADDLKINIEDQKYNAHAIVDSWRYDDEPLERLYELTARHLGLFFLFTPNLQDEYQTEIMNKFLDKVYNEHKARLTTAGLNREQFDDILWDKILDKYPYFYDFQYKPEHRERQFVREGLLEQLADFYVDNYHETLLAFPVNEETIKELPESLQKMPFEQIQKDIEAAQEEHQHALDKLADPNDKIKYLEAQLASHTRMQHLLSRKSKEGIKERQLKLLQAELETLNDRMEDEDVSKRRDSLEKAIKAWQEPLAMASEDLEENIKTLQQQLKTSSKLSILTEYTFELFSANSEEKNITEIRKELEKTIGAENIMYSEDALSQSPTEMEKYSTQARSIIEQFYYGPPSPTPTSEDEDYNPEDTSSSYSSSEDEEDWEIEFDDASIQKQDNLNLPKAISTLGDGNCAFNAMALGIADLVRANQFSETYASDTLNHRRTKFYALLQEKLSLEAPTQAAFKSWLKNKSDIQIQTSLAPLMRKFVVDKIREDIEYNANYKENYETILVGAFDGFLNGRMAEDDTFAVHNFIREKFESLNSASLLSLSSEEEIIKILQLFFNLNGNEKTFIIWLQENFDNPNLSEKQMYDNLKTLFEGDEEAIARHVQNFINEWYQQKNEKQNAELLRWWRAEGKEQYFDNLSEPASGAWDTEKWASDVEPGALALDLGINLTREKTNFAPAVFGPGNGLIPIDKEDVREAEIFNFLRDIGFGYEYQGYFRLADYIKSIEDLERLSNRASDDVFKFLENYKHGEESYDNKTPIDITSVNPSIVKELRERNLLNLSYGKYYLRTDNKIQIEAALNGLSDNLALKDIIIKHFYPETPSIAIQHGGGHWTYMRLSSMEKFLEPNNVTSKSISQQQELKDYAETIQAEAGLTSLKIESSATGLKMSSSDILEQKKLIDYLMENNINFKRNEFETHLDPIETQKLISIIKPIMQKTQVEIQQTADILSSFKLAKTASTSNKKKRKTFTESESEGYTSDEEDNGLKQDSEEESVTNDGVKRRKLVEVDDTSLLHTIITPTDDRNGRLQNCTTAERYTKETSQCSKWKDFVHKMEDEEMIEAEKSETKPSTGITGSSDMHIDLPTTQESTIPNHENTADAMKDDDVNNLIQSLNSPSFRSR